MLAVKTVSFFLLAVIAAVLVSGCNAGPNPDLDTNYTEKSGALGKWVEQIWTRTKGDWNQLTPDEQKKFIESFSGNEASAKSYWARYTPGKIVGPGGPASQVGR